MDAFKRLHLEGIKKHKTLLCVSIEHITNDDIKVIYGTGKKYRREISQILILLIIELQGGNSPQG